ncbi:MAG TPA: peptide ABC transporter ATP-binding protein, partial [Ruminococcaceae bacterium]|nr:peptide ABC transporter ATP-binding protein [Oscillospiraceae bacterium]
MEFGSGESRIQALDRVSFHADPGKVLCIVGESGCGKSVTALSIMGLLPKNARVTGGSIRFDGQDLLRMDEAQLNKIRGNTLAMIFQDAMTSLNPVFTVGNQLTEAIRLHSGLSKKDARE